MTKDERLSKEQERLFSIFADLDENALQVAEGLINQACFMLVTLEDLQKAIAESGAVGTYQNGEHQSGTKQSAELQAYNQTLRSYNAVIGKLLKIVPHKPVKIETPQERWERYKKERMEKEKVDSKIRKLEHFCEQLDDEGGDADVDE